jgi:hypothetical protein
MSITMILSLLVCAAGLGLVVAGMALPLCLLPEDADPGRGRGGVHGALSRFSGDSQARLSP